MTFTDLFRKPPKPSIRAVGAPDMFDGIGRGTDLPAIKADVLAAAREFYGPDAELAVTSVGTVRAFQAAAPRERFQALVVVQCRNFRKVAQS